MSTIEQALQKAVAERDRLSIVIAYLSEQLGVPVPPSGDQGPQPPGPGAPRVDPTTGRVDPISLVKEAEFFGMSAPAAAIAVLQKVGRPNALKTTVLVQAIRKGGVPVKDPATLFRSMIRNSKLTKVDKGLWGLSEWYPKGATPKASPSPATVGSATGDEPESEERPDVAS